MRSAETRCSRASHRVGAQRALAGPFRRKGLEALGDFSKQFLLFHRFASSSSFSMPLSAFRSLEVRRLLRLYPKPQMTPQYTGCLGQGRQRNTRLTRIEQTVNHRAGGAHAPR